MALGPPRIRLYNGHMNLVAARVKAKRREAKLTQDQFAARISDATLGKWIPSRKDIWRIESGSRLITDLELTGLSAVLKCSAAWLLYGDLATLSPEEIAARIFADPGE